MNKLEKTIYSNDLKWELDGLTLKNALVIIGDWINKYGEDAKIDIDMDYPDQYSTSETAVLCIRQKRLETDEEYEARMIIENNRYREIELRERLELEKLLKKYGA